MNLSHLEPIDCPLPNLQIFLACVISGIDLIFHSFYGMAVLTSWDRSMRDSVPCLSPVSGGRGFQNYYGCGKGGGTKVGSKPSAAGNADAVGRMPVRTQESIAFTAVKIWGPVKAQ